MRSRTSTWFEAKIRYDKTMDDGSQKTVTEQYAVDAITFGEAEESVTSEMEAYISGDFKVVALKIAQYSEIYFSDKEADDKYFKATLQFITKDEKSEKEKKSNVYYLMQAKDIDVARRYVDEAMKGTMIDYNIASLSETKILDVFEHNKKS